MLPDSLTEFMTCPWTTACIAVTFALIFDTSAEKSCGSDTSVSACVQEIIDTDATVMDNIVFGSFIAIEF